MSQHAATLPRQLVQPKRGTMTTVLWEEIEIDGLIVEPLERLDETLAALKMLRSASNLGELRRAELPGWAREVVASFELSLEDNEEPSGDDVAFHYDSIGEQVAYAVPLPIDADDTEAWLGADLLKLHAEVSGASPGGHAGEYRIQNREVFLAALRDAGFEPVHRPGFYAQLQSAC